MKKKLSYKLIILHLLKSTLNPKRVKKYPILMFTICHAVIMLLPKQKIAITLKEDKIFSLYINRIEKIRIILNCFSMQKREHLARKFIIPIINELFDRNYVNYAQYALFSLEEWFLSKNNDAEFAEALSLFSEHAIAAGLRFRQKFPLHEIDNENKKIGFVSNWVGKIGFEVILGLGKYLKDFSPAVYGNFVYSPPHEKHTIRVFREQGIKVIIPEEQFPYNVFALRQLFTVHPVKTTLWVLPPMHMFFLFSFGLSRQQIFFSQYIHPNLNFPYLDDVLTLGGSGHTRSLNFEGRKWNVLPQLTYIESLKFSNAKYRQKILFIPFCVNSSNPFLDVIVKILKCNQDICVKLLYDPDPQSVSACSEHFKKNKVIQQTYYVSCSNFSQLNNEIADSDIILEPFSDASVSSILPSIIQANKPLISPLYPYVLSPENYVQNVLQILYNKEAELRNKAFWRTFLFSFSKKDHFISEEGRTKIKKKEPEHSTILFAPCREEKIKQSGYLTAVFKILEACPDTVFKWTGLLSEPDPNILKEFVARNMLHRQIFIPWMNNTVLLEQIEKSDIILETFPIGFGTTAIMASIFEKPIISMYSENPLYWRDSYFEACQGDKILRNICVDDKGESRLKQNHSIEEYVADAIMAINNASYRYHNAQIYKSAFEYTHLNNPTDIGERFSEFLNSLEEV